MKTGPVWNILHTSTLFAWLYQCASVLKQGEIKTMPDFLRRHCSFTWTDYVYNHKEQVVPSAFVTTDEIVRKILLYRVFLIYLQMMWKRTFSISLPFFISPETNDWQLKVPLCPWKHDSSVTYTLILLFLWVNTT